MTRSQAREQDIAVGFRIKSATFARSAFGAKVSAMRLATRALAAVMIAALTSGCKDVDSNFVRGRGLAIATLPAPARASVYEAAARGAFELDESLWLLLDGRILPRDIGLAPDGRVPATVLDEMQRRGVIRGTCEPALQGVRGVPVCTAARPGYVVRYSPVFTLGPDSVQVYIYVQKYDVPGAEPSQVLRFERAYQVVRHGDEWRAVREGRVPKAASDQPKK
jgi:hypothetical protein